MCAWGHLSRCSGRPRHGRSTLTYRHAGGQTSHGQRVPKAGLSSCSNVRAGLLDHFIGAGDEGGWNRDTERLRRLEINDQLEFVRSLNGQVGRFCPFQDAAHIVCRLAIGVGQVAAVAHEASEHRILSPRIAPHHRVMGGERNNALAPAVEEWVAFDNDSAGAERSNRLERLVQLNLSACMNYIELDAKSARGIAYRTFV